VNRQPVLSPELSDNQELESTRTKQFTERYVSLRIAFFRIRNFYRNLTENFLYFHLSSLILTDNGGSQSLAIKTNIPTGNQSGTLQTEARITSDQALLFTPFFFSLHRVFRFFFFFIFIFFSFQKRYQPKKTFSELYFQGKENSNSIYLHRTNFLFCFKPSSSKTTLSYKNELLYGHRYHYFSLSLLQQPSCFRFRR
jgi:hypothetical protein